MKKISIYRASDGSRFDSEKECARYEQCKQAVIKLLKRLPALPRSSGCRFENGEGWIQHDAGTWNQVWSAFYALVTQYHPSFKKYPLGSYGFGRSLDDSGSPFYGYYMRYCNTNRDLMREYGQAYYANHPSEAKGCRINKEPKCG